MWEPIEDLLSDSTVLSDGELDPLLGVWDDLRSELKESGGLDQFRSELEREWAIETGQIEGIYDIERGVTRTLIERGISADLIPHTPGQRQPEVIAAILRDHADVLEGLFQFVRNERTLSKSYINQVHAALLEHQATATVVDQFGNVFETELLKGQYKKLPNNPTKPDGTKHLYCPPEHVDAEMDRLIAMHYGQMLAGVPVEIQAAWLHHRFTQVHPYQDGNGRVARALASLLFIKAGWFPVVVTRDDRVRYLDALEVADDGDLRSLVACLVDIQKRTLFQATKIAAEAAPVATVDDAIKSVKRVITRPIDLESRVWKAKGTADTLMEVVGVRLRQVQESLQKEIGPAKRDFRAFLLEESLDAPPEDFGFSPNRIAYHRAYTLLLQTDFVQQGNAITIQAYGIGNRFDGLIGMFAFVHLEGKGQSEVASKDPFQINYRESSESTERRFRQWLEKSIVRALTMWRESL